MTIAELHQDTASHEDSEMLGSELIRPLLEAPHFPANHPSYAGAKIGTLVAIIKESQIPLVIFPEQPENVALAARTTVNLNGGHIGKQVVLMFENAHPSYPIIMGVLCESGNWPLDEKPGSVEVTTNGTHMTISAKQQLELNCGKSSLVLHEDGRVELYGESILTHATKANRIRGGSVQLN